MTDLAKGIIEINGFTFRPKTTLEEVLAYYGDKARVLHSLKFSKVKLLKPYYITENIYSCSFTFDGNGYIRSLSLIPVTPPEVTDTVDVANYALEISKQWLDKVLGVKPDTSNDICIYYKFPNVDYYACISADRDYGMSGGEIVVTFHEV